MLLGLGECLLYYEGQWYDTVTVEPCEPEEAGDGKGSRTDRPPPDRLPPDRTLPVTKRKSTIIKGVPDLYLGIGAAGVFMFMLILALKR